jgi:hypothetical protein
VGNCGENLLRRRVSTNRHMGIIPIKPCLGAAMHKVIAVTLLIVGTTIAAVHGLQTNHKIMIPKVLTYPTTTLAFSSKAVLSSSQVKAAAIRVKFDDPSWAASVSVARWVTTGGGTYFKFTCEASSTSCMQASKGLGTYTYALTPTTAPAPRGYGRYALIWDVNPPGDLVNDAGINVPEIDPTTGAAALALLAGAVLLIRGRRKKEEQGK